MRSAPVRRISLIAALIVLVVTLRVPASLSRLRWHCPRRLVQLAISHPTSRDVPGQASEVEEFSVQGLVGACGTVDGHRGPESEPELLVVVDVALVTLVALGGDGGLGGFGGLFDAGGRVLGSKSRMVHALGGSNTLGRGFLGCPGVPTPGSRRSAATGTRRLICSLADSRPLPDPLVRPLPDPWSLPRGSHNFPLWGSERRLGAGFRGVPRVDRPREIAV